MVSSTNVEIKTEIKEESKDDSDEPDFVETNCHWGECTIQFDTQQQLASNTGNGFIRNSDLETRQTDIPEDFFQ